MMICFWFWEEFAKFGGARHRQQKTPFCFQNENFTYIQNASGSIVTANPHWSGIQDGVSFTIRHRNFSNVKEANDLLVKMIDSVRAFQSLHQFVLSIRMCEAWLSFAKDSQRNDFCCRFLT